MITLKRTGFLWRIIGIIYGMNVDKTFTNFCPLFWLTVATIFIWPIVLLVRLVIYVIDKIIDFTKKVGRNKAEKKEPKEWKEPKNSTPRRNGKSPLVKFGILSGKVITRLLETAFFLIAAMTLSAAAQNILVTDKELSIVSLIVAVIAMLAGFIVALVWAVPVIGDLWLAFYRKNCPLINWKGEKK